MKQEYNRAMDQVKLPPEAGARILRTLEERAQAPRRRRRRGPLIAALAGAAALLMGAAAVAGRSTIFPTRRRRSCPSSGRGPFPSTSVRAMRAGR